MRRWALSPRPMSQFSRRLQMTCSRLTAFVNVHRVPGRHGHPLRPRKVAAKTRLRVLQPVSSVRTRR